MEIACVTDGMLVAHKKTKHPRNFNVRECIYFSTLSTSQREVDYASGGMFSNNIYACPTIAWNLVSPLCASIIKCVSYKLTTNSVAEYA